MWNSMGRAGSRTVLALVAIAAGAASASAAEDYCINPNTRQVDQQATANFQQLERTATPQYMQYFAGIWYRRARNPYTGQVSDQYQQFQRNGLWNYQDTVCSAQGFCSRYSGTGLFAVRANASVQNGFFGVIDVSDSTRNHQCLGFSGRLLSQTQFVDSTNTVWQRVR